MDYDRRSEERAPVRGLLLAGALLALGAIVVMSHAGSNGLGENVMAAVFAIGAIACFWRASR